MCFQQQIPATSVHRVATHGMDTLPWKLCICVEGLSMCRRSNEGNPLTEHVQSVYWACAGNINEGKSSDDPVFDSFD